MYSGTCWYRSAEILPWSHPDFVPCSNKHLPSSRLPFRTDSVWPYICISSLFFLNLLMFYFMDMSVLLHVCLYIMWVPLEVKREHWFPWAWNYRQLWAVMSVLRIKPGSSPRAVNALTTEPSLQLRCSFLKCKIWLCVGHVNFFPEHPC